MIPPFVGRADLAAIDPARLVIADVRWYLDGRPGRAAYESGHLPGAVFVDLDRDLSDHGLSDRDLSDRGLSDGSPPIAGRHPFPTAEAFAAAMGRLGIGDDSVVVAYDDSGGLTAGRLVLMLRMLNREAAVLSGDPAAWPEPLERGPGRAIHPASFTAQPWPANRLADADEAVAHAAAGGALLDARSAERFAGAVVAVDKRPGHIPGARSSPSATLVDADLRIRPTAELRRHFAARGVGDDRSAIAYCGSGVSAALNVLAIEAAGLPPARLYVASWSGYSADPQRPAELGSEDGR